MNPILVTRTSSYSQRLIASTSRTLCLNFRSTNRPRFYKTDCQRTPHHRRDLRNSHPQLQSSFFPTVFTGLLAVSGIITYWALSSLESEPKDTTPQYSPVSFTMAQPDGVNGFVGNLTLEQTQKLKQFWRAVFRVCGVEVNGSNVSSASEKAGRGEDKFGLAEQFQDIVSKHSPEVIREAVWSMVKCDHPDALALRFLRARKWDVQNALVMFISAVNWRHNEMHVDDEILKWGEGGAAIDEKGSDGHKKQVGGDFMSQLRMGKSFLHGVDKAGRPLCVVRVRLHKHGEQCTESIEKFTVQIIETARLLLSPEVETATIIFDMTGFSIANLDYAPVKFMIKCFEANYPESLGAVLIHNSPWLFQGIWRIIRGWLDPVVASKVHFTNNKSGLEQYIEGSKLLKDFGGDEDWQYKYQEPIAGENDLMKDTAARDEILSKRTTLVKDMEVATAEWIFEEDQEKDANIYLKRHAIAHELKDNYWKLDGYIRAKTLYDRQGIIGPGGSVQWYGTN